MRVMRVKEGMVLKTEILDESGIHRAAEILRSGGIVAIPTETVYGLAANAYDKQAIKSIYRAKGRPSDNPLIVHISDISAIYDVVSQFPENAQKLAGKFWPGPLTMILPKNPKIPREVTGGLDSVAVRFPSHIVAQKIISEAGVPLVAPSANISGRPSPTKFEHVIHDLDGKINAIVNGGDCDVGLESTVVSMLGEVPKILRPGRITAEDIRKVVGAAEIDIGVFKNAADDRKVISPGMKYKHYSPRTQVKIILGSSGEYIDFVNDKKEANAVALCFDEEVPSLKVPCVAYGSADNTREQAQNLFDALRKVDDFGANIVYAHYVEKDDFSLAVYNRLVRAAGFDIINL